MLKRNPWVPLFFTLEVGVSPYLNTVFKYSIVVSRNYQGVDMRYWMGVASAEHVARGQEGGFCQLCHGKAQPLQRMSPGDWLIYYSPQLIFGSKQACQQFTALGQVCGTEVYPFAMAENFTPHRRDVNFLAAQPVSIRPLIEQLSFIRDKSKWGYAFRFGHFEINQADFFIIAQAMQVDMRGIYIQEL